VTRCCVSNLDLFKRPYQIDPDVAALNALVRSYQGGATRRGHAFKLSLGECIFLFNSNCYYCGAEPANIKRSGTGRYVYNGIDRVENDVGYVGTNVVACCSACNYAKGTRGLPEYLEWVERSYLYQMKYRDVELDVKYDLIDLN